MSIFEERAAEFTARIDEIANMLNEFAGEVGDFHCLLAEYEFDHEDQELIDRWENVASNVNNAAAHMINAQSDTLGVHS